MGQSKNKTIEELAKLLSGAMAMQEKITMTEALCRDLLIVLFGAEGTRHECIEYSDEQVIGFSKCIIDECYRLRGEADRLRKENAGLREELEKASWWRALFCKKNAAK